MVETIEITDFSGRLTRIQNGQLNSGFAKFDTSWGYDPFSKPMNLTWLYKPDDITINSGGVIEPFLATAFWTGGNISRAFYAVGGSTGANAHIYQIDPTDYKDNTDTPLYDTASILGLFNLGDSSYLYGANMENYRNLLYVSTDNYLKTYNPATFAQSVVGQYQSVIGTNQVPHPMKPFLNAMYVGNGNNLAVVNASGTLLPTQALTPSLPTGTYIVDLDVTPDGTYLVMTTSTLLPPKTTDVTAPPIGAPYAAPSTTYLWNGTDATITSSNQLPSYPPTAYNTFLDHQYTFMTDSFGMAIYEGKQKMLTLPQNLSPLAQSVTPNGQFITWCAPEVTGTTNSSTQPSNSYASLYYYGSLDHETPVGLYRMARIAPTGGGSIYNVLFNVMVNNYSFYQKTVSGWGKHYVSLMENASGTVTPHVYRFVLPPAGNTNPQFGVYETQTQLFSKRIGVGQIRVYTEPTAVNNAFQIDLIGSDGTVIPNGTFIYSYGQITDPQSGSSAVERINFNPDTKTQYALGIRLTNTGTSNMTIRKIEVDISHEGK